MSNYRSEYSTRLAAIAKTTEKCTVEMYVFRHEIQVGIDLPGAFDRYEQL